MRRALLCLLLLATTCRTAHAASAECVSPSCAEWKIDAPAGDYSTLVFTTNLGPTGYFRANVSITAIKSDPTWWPFCSLMVSSKSENDSNYDSIRISLVKDPGKKQIDFSIKAVHREKLVKEDEFPGNLSIGTAVPLEISWKPGEFEIAFGNRNKTYKTAFRPRFAYLACSTAAGTFESIETRYDTKTDACDEALTSLNLRQDQGSARDTELTAAYRKERDGGNRQQAQKLYCDMRAITIKDQTERLEIFKSVMRLCARDRISTRCDLNCRIRDLQAELKVANKECGEDATSRSTTDKLRQPPPAESTPVAPPSPSSWPTEGKRIPNFYGTTW